MEWTLENIIKIVDESKDLTATEQVKIANSLPIFTCSLYVLHMKKKHRIVVSI